MNNHRRTPRSKESLAVAELGEAAAAEDMLAVDPLALERTVFNAERTHRFTLFRHWGDPDDYVAGVCCNPAGATASLTDRTVSKMVKFSREKWGAGAYYMLNALSIRGTYSTELGQAPQVNLPENDEWIRRIAGKAKFVVVAWGNPGVEFGRDKEVEAILRQVCDPAKVYCFGRNKTTNAPVHPLYQPFSAKLVPYFTAA